ncbi:MAG TPA: hypothetical protein VKE49_00145, partial [Myxococcaceae bacterium]|nr:hypothetical protein [Myxococcaceae bacterium]
MKTREISQLAQVPKPVPIQLPGFDPVRDDPDLGFADADLVEPSPAPPQPPAVPLPGGDSFGDSGPAWQSSPPNDSAVSPVNHGAADYFPELGESPDSSAAAV